MRRGTGSDRSPFRDLSCSRRALLSDAATIIGPVAAVYVGHKLSKGDAPKAPPPPQEPPKAPAEPAE
jgi:hypothetical protein